MNKTTKESAIDTLKLAGISLACVVFGLSMNSKCSSGHGANKKADKIELATAKKDSIAAKNIFQKTR